MLTLSMLRCPDGVPPETRIVSGTEFSIGRDARNDWVLPDPDKFLSKRHCVLRRDGGGWLVSDASTNGTYLNHDIDPIGSSPRGLRDGDRILLGGYEIEVALQAGEEPLYRPADLHEHRRPADPDPQLADDRLVGDPFPRAPADPLGLASNTGIGLPKGYDPMSPEDEFRDDAPPMQDAAFLDARYRPPNPASDLLPDDWDEIAPDPVRPSAPTPPEPAFDAPPPRHEPDPEPAPELAAPPPPAPPPPPPVIPVAAERIAVPPPTPRVPETGDLEPGLAAFLHGAGLASVAPPAGHDAATTLRGLGAAFRAMVHGLRRIMIGRASIKGEFRIEQTMIRASGNNPLKFSADDDDALSALLNLGRRSELSPEAAIADALRDMRLHELAMMTAMQEAVRDLLARLGPQRLLDEAGTHPLDALPAWRKARAWTGYASRHAQVVEALSDDFDSVFGKAFARAYERAMADSHDAGDPT